MGGTAVVLTGRRQLSWFPSAWLGMLPANHSLTCNELQSLAGEFQWRAPSHRRLCWWPTSKCWAADVPFLEGGVTSYVTLQSRLKIGLHSLCHVAQWYVRTYIFRKFLLWAERVKSLAWFAGCWLCPDLSFLSVGACHSPAGLWGLLEPGYSASPGYLLIRVAVKG